jgi:hypothetical protein
MGDIANALGAAPPPNGVGSSGVLGFFGNLLGDVTGVAKGLGSLGGMALADLGHLVTHPQEAFTFGAAQGGFHLDDVAKALPGAIASDYAGRYGSPSKFLKGLYEHPGSFLLDLASLGSGAATLAEGAAGLGRAGQIGRALGLSGEAGALGGKFQALSRAAEFADAGNVDKAAQLAAKAGFAGGVPIGEAAAAAGKELAGAVPEWVKKVLPGIGTAEAGGTRLLRVGQDFQSKGFSTNPVRRELLQKPIAALRSEPIGKLEQDVAELGAAAEATGHAGFSKIHEVMQAQLDQAHSLGLTKIEKGSVSTWRVKQAANKLFAGARQEAYDIRNTKTRALLEALGPVAKAGLDEPAQAAFQGLDIEIPHLRGAAEKAAAESPGLAATLGAPSAVPGAVATITTPLREPVVSDAMEATRKLMAADEDVMLSRGELAPGQALDRAYRPLRQKYGATFDAKAVDPVTGLKGAWVGGPSAEELQAMLKGAGIAEPIYFPHFDPHRVKLGDFLMPNKISRLQKTPGYLKLNRGTLLAKGDYVKSPVDAYTRRAALATMHDEAWGTAAKAIDTFGIPLTSQEAKLLPPGWAAVNLDGLKRFLNSQTALGDAYLDAQFKGTASEEALAKALKATEGVQDEVAGALANPEADRLFAVPKAVMDSLQSQIRPLIGADAEKFLRNWWDTPLNLWRGAVLSGSPRWIINNLLGNVTFLKMQGGRVRDAAAIMATRFKKLLNEKLGSNMDTSLLDALDAVPGIGKARGGLFSSSQQVNVRRGAALDTRAGKFAEGVSQSPVGKGFHRFGEAMRGLNSQVEDAFREASYLKAGERLQMKAGIQRTARSFWSTKARAQAIAEHGLTPANSKALLDEVNYFFNDYTKMGPLERRVLKRFISPFWSFYKHVVKLTLTYPLDYAGKGEILKKLADVSAEIGADIGPLPSFLQGATPIGAGSEQGATRFLNTRGPNPFSTLLQDPLSVVSPPIKVLLEQIQGRSTLTGQDFTAPDVVQPFGSDFKFKMVNGQPVPIEKVRPGILEHLLRQFPQFNLAEDLLSGGRRYDTSNLLDILKSRTIGTSPEHAVLQTNAVTGEPRVPYDLLQKLLTYAGVSTTDYNVPNYQGRLSREEEAALKAWLTRIGAAGAAP